ncbi:MAG TPA: phosphoribosylaminoimidazolesuccinocarboxamide synthase [Pseudanabaena sp.]|nr:phosphoribosylaminoimidazolesuccinocarboxamide synthase [Pseudanabaena sp.]
MSGTKLYEGKAKILFTTDDPDILLSLYKDDATAFNALKKGTIANKGQINCAIASHIFQYLEAKGIATHFIKQISPNEMQVAAVKILPIEVVVRNIAAGSICKRLGLEQGQPLKQPLVEFFYKNDELGDPLITDAHVAMLDLATPKQVEDLKQIALSINQHLQAFFDQCNLILVDFKVEIGVNSSGKMLLADEISPDTCRLWDKAIVDPTARILDKDRFRQDLGNVAEAYHEVLRRVLATQSVAI